MRESLILREFEDEIFTGGVKLAAIKTSATSFSLKGAGIGLGIVGTTLSGAAPAFAIIGGMTAMGYGLYYVNDKIMKSMLRKAQS